MSQNPFDQHSFAVPRYPHQCAHPACQLAISQDRMLCELHGSAHRPRQGVEDEEGDE